MIDLKNLGSYRENNRIEAKQAVGGFPHSVWETYSAFANTFGGIILLGVAEAADKSLHAVTLPSPEALVRSFHAGLQDRRCVSADILPPDAIRIEEADGKRIVVVEVPRATVAQKPVYIGGSVSDGSYRRCGEGDYRCSPEEIAAMLRDAAGLDDSRPMTHLNTTALDFAAVASYRAADKENAGSKAESATAYLKEIGVLIPDGSGVLHPCAAGLLMFGKPAAIHRVFPAYSLSFHTVGIDATDADAVYDGCLYTFYRDMSKALSTRGQDAENKALREALVNAICHADYELPGGVKVIKTANAVRIENPGGSRVSQTAALRGAHSPRNHALCALFRRIYKGQGLPGIFSAWQGEGYQAPLIRERFAPDRFTLTLCTVPRAEQRRAEREADRFTLLDALMEHPLQSVSFYAKACGRTEHRMRDLLREMTRDGIVQQSDTRPALYTLSR